MARPKHDDKRKRQLSDRAIKKKKSAERRWAKGQSCESNPKSKKFRDEASSQYFHQVLKNPLLTLNNVGHRFEMDDDESDILSDDLQSLTVSDARSARSMSTTKTFASGWSKCTNRAFERFMSKCKLDSALHKDMLSLLAATTEVIDNVGGSHKESEYFASFICSLEKCEKEQYHPMMALIAMIIGKVSESVLRIKFLQIIPKIQTILSYGFENEEHALIRLCCEVLSKLLKAQSLAVFESEGEGVQQIIKSILKCGLHENPKVRRKARWCITALMNHYNEKGSKRMVQLIIDYVLEHFENFPACGPKIVLDVLGLLYFTSSFMKSLKSNWCKKLCEGILRVMSSGDVSILKISFAVFASIFQNSLTIVKKESIEGSSFTTKVLTALWNFQPDTRSHDTYISWLNCILNGATRLAEEDKTLALKYTPLIFESASSTWDSNFGAATTALICRFLVHIVPNDEGDVVRETMISIIEECFQILSKNLISIPPSSHCIKLLDFFLDTLSPWNFCPGAREVFLQLVPLRDSVQGMESTLGRFVRAFGVENLWAAVDNEAKLTVLLPLLRDNLNQGKFSFWKSTILPLASLLPTATYTLAWDSLIGFCRNSADPKEFPAEIIGKCLVEKPNVRLEALSALRQLSLWPQSKIIMEKYAKNFIPILFNLYVEARDEKKDKILAGHGDALGSTIQAYLPFCDDEFSTVLMSKALAKMDVEKETGFRNCSPGLLDVLSFLAAGDHQTEVWKSLLDIAESLIDDPLNMKRGYRILLALVKNNDVDGEIKQGILGLLRKTKGNAKSNAQALRIDILSAFIDKDESLIEEFLPEAILHLLSVNGKTRKLAVRFALKACEKIKKEGGSLELLDGVIQYGMRSTIPLAIATTLNFLTLATEKLRPERPNESILTFVLAHQSEDSFEPFLSDDLVRREILSYISINLSMFKSQIGPWAPEIGAILLKPGFARKDVNKVLARMIRAFGLAGLKAVLPSANATDAKLQTRLRNLDKKLRRLKRGERKKKEDEQEEGKDDEECESEEDEGNFLGLAKGRLSTGKDGLFIKEGLVDFLDVKDVTGALISKPQGEKESSEFKVSADGKLIIGGGEEEKSGEEVMWDEDEDNEDEWGERKSRGVKRKSGGAASVASSSKSRTSAKTTNTNKSGRREKTRKVGGRSVKSVKSSRGETSGGTSTRGGGEHHGKSKSKKMRR